MRRCKGCGKPIPVERLEAVPETTRCVWCQSAWERIARPMKEVPQAVLAETLDHEELAELYRSSLGY